MKIYAYLNFDGHCAEAFRLYERVLGGKIEMMMTHGESPFADQTPAAQKDRILHVRLAVGDQVLMGSDAPPEFKVKPQGFAVSLFVDSAADADRIFNALAQGGQVTLPIDRSFWAERFGMVVDRFGTSWMINYEGAAGPA
jgi:PhnB protein